VITRPNDLIILGIELFFNQRLFFEIEIDLFHINKNGRSSFDALEIKDAFQRQLYGKTFAPSSTRGFGSEICEYFIVILDLGSKKHKLVFCICSDRPDTIGIITFHRV
jgi:hypothetical protein